MFLADTQTIADRVAIIDELDNRLTYGELGALSVEYRSCIPTRSLVLIMCDYAIETVAFYYCQMANGVAPLLVDKSSRPDFLSKIIKTYEPEFIWCPYELGNTWVGMAVEKISETGTHVLLKTPFGACAMNSRLALLLTTSGTTGSIKFVKLSYDNLTYNARAFSEKIGLCGDDIGITTLPMHHCYGLSLLHMHWILGACVYVTEYSVLDVRFWELFRRGNITNFAGVTYTYEILRQTGFLEKDYKSLRLVTQGGASMDDERKKEFSRKLGEKNVRFYACYGQTEATTCISCLSPEKVMDKPGSVGEPLTGIEISVENPDESGVGELIINGRTVSLGYVLCKEDMARGDDNRGCLRTGDMAYVDADGDIFLKGRKSRFVKLFGERVSLDELEKALSLHFHDTEFACSGRDNEIDIYYVGSVEKEEITDFCRSEFSIPGKLAECHRIKEIPHASNGKVDYAMLRRL